MAKVKGLQCRECGRPYPAKPLHVCEFCFGPLEVDYDYASLEKVVSRKRIE
ncbi:MAG: threonine synthase, partial [candidate division NC10 bacterium]